MPLPEVNPTVVERVQFLSGPHRLEGELAYADSVADSLRESEGRRGAMTPHSTGDVFGAVVLAGSHPLLGGNMHNNVVRGVGDGLAERGWATLRFNYRGVGGSEGPRVDVARHMAEFWQTSHVPGEMDLWHDVQAGVAFLRSNVVPSGPLVLVGYSFGCALLPSVCQCESPAAVVLIAPPLSKHDYTDFDAVKCPLLVIVSENDFTLEPERLRAWYERLPGPKQLVQAALDNHFFRGHEPWLVEIIAAFLQEHCP